VNYASFLAEIWPEGVRRVDLSRCRVIKWIVAPFHGNLPNLLNDPRTYICILAKVPARLIFLSFISVSLERKREKMNRVQRS